MPVEITKGFEECINSMDLKNPDFTITETKISCWGKNDRTDGGFVIEWKTKSAGWGNTTVYKKDGKLICNNEGMGKEFIKSVLNHLVESLELLD